MGGTLLKIDSETQQLTIWYRPFFWLDHIDSTSVQEGLDCRELQ